MVTILMSHLIFVMVGAVNSINILPLCPVLLLRLRFPLISYHVADKCLFLLRGKERTAFTCWLVIRQDLLTTMIRQMPGGGALTIHNLHPIHTNLLHNPLSSDIIFLFVDRVSAVESILHPISHSHHLITSGCSIQLFHSIRSHC